MCRSASKNREWNRIKIERLTFNLANVFDSEYK